MNKRVLAAVFVFVMLTAGTCEEEATDILLDDNDPPVLQIDDDGDPPEAQAPAVTSFTLTGRIDHPGDPDYGAAAFSFCDGLSAVWVNGTLEGLPGGTEIAIRMVDKDGNVVAEGKTTSNDDQSFELGLGLPGYGDYKIEIIAVDGRDVTPATFEGSFTVGDPQEEVFSVPPYVFDASAAPPFDTAAFATCP